METYFDRSRSIVFLLFSFLSHIFVLHLLMSDPALDSGGGEEVDHIPADADLTC